MIDVQNLSDDRDIAIDEVGISELQYPIVVLDRSNERQHTIATFKMSVGLPKHFKGTHMSRLVEVLHEHHGELTMFTVPKMLHALRERLSAGSASITVRFPYFLERTAPVSGIKGMMDYDCWFKGSLSGDKNEFILGVCVPITTLCPCSKTISDYGAHNQRGNVTIEVRMAPVREGDKEGLVWIEELVDLAESSGSAPVYAALKRTDERHLTMKAYDNPMFVEDVVRNVATWLKNNSRIEWFSVYTLSQESIHNHSAFAKIEWTR